MGRGTDGCLAGPTRRWGAPRFPAGSPVAICLTDIAPEAAGGLSRRRLTAAAPTPRLHHQRRSVAAGNAPAPSVDPAARPHRLPQPSNHDQAARVGDPIAPAPHPRCGRRALYAQSAFVMAVPAYRRGVCRSAVDCRQVPRAGAFWESGTVFALSSRAPRSGRDRASGQTEPRRARDRG